MSSSSSSAVGDPRRPAEVHSFVREPLDLSNDPTDWYSPLSLLVGTLSFVLKWKVLAWCCFILCGASFANMRAVDSDIKSLTMSIMFASMSLVSAYTGNDAHAVAVPLSTGSASIDTP